MSANKMKVQKDGLVITIPSNIIQEFFNLLDLAQASVTDEDERTCSKAEQECLIFVRKMLPNPSKPFKSHAEAKEAARKFVFLS
jgi:hypothetical protein